MDFMHALRADGRIISRSRRALLLVFALVADAKAADRAVAGEVKDTAGDPLAGVFVTARDAVSSREVTVYTDAAGRYALTLPDTGQWLLRAHHTRLTAAEQPLPSAGATADFSLAPARDPRAGATTAAWFATVPDSPEKREFILNCASCHEITAGRLFKDGVLRDRAGWVAGITLMKALDVYAVIPPDFSTEHYAEWMAQQFSPAQVATVEPQGFAAPSLAEEQVVITEYPVPVASELPHDLVVGPDARIWITAFWTNEIWAMTPATGEYAHYAVNAEKDVIAQVRALEFDRAGKLWVVNGGTSSVVRLDPTTRHFDTFKVGMYPHDLVLDSQGNAWVNDYFAKRERIAKVSAADGAVTIIPLPSLERPAEEGVPLSYGLQVDAKDRLWSTQLAANTLIRHDIAAGKSQLYAMPEPNSGPRRTAVGPDGRVWIPEFNTGVLTSFDPATETFERFDTGMGAAGVYDVAVDARSGEVWLGAALASALIRFDPRTRRFTHYPMPTEPAYMRHLAIDPATGDVWTAWSSLPTAVPKIARLSRRPRTP
jgi:virginiamycin B lyase